MHRFSTAAGAFPAACPGMPLARCAAERMRDF